MLVIRHEKRKPLGFPFTLLAESEAPFAEGEGFKPPIPERGIPDFESSAIDHSCKGSIFFRYYQIYLGKSCLEATFYSKESLFRRFFSCSASDLRMDSLISQVLS